MYLDFKQERSIDFGNNRGTRDVIYKRGLELALNPLGPGPNLL